MTKARFAVEERDFSVIRRKPATHQAHHACHCAQSWCHRPHAAIAFQDSVRSYAAPRDESVRAIIGRISQSNMSYLVTAGTDRSIRFWDFAAPSRCYTISGLEAAQPKVIFDAPKLNDGSSGKLFVCYVAATPSADKILQMHLPAREGRGIVLPSPNAKVSYLLFLLGCLFVTMRNCPNRSYQCSVLLLFVTLISCTHNNFTGCHLGSKEH